MKETRSLAIWHINDKYYLQAYSVSVDGIRYGYNNPIHVLDKDQQKLLGLEILETLKECQHQLPNPSITDRNTEIKLLSTLKVKSFKELMQKGKTVSVYFKQNELKIIPDYFNGKYLTSSPDRYMYCSLDPDDITRTVLEAFERCHP